MMGVNAGTNAQRCLDQGSVLPKGWKNLRVWPMAWKVTFFQQLIGMVPSSWMPLPLKTDAAKLAHITSGRNEPTIFMK